MPADPAHSPDPRHPLGHNQSPPTPHRPALSPTDALALLQALPAQDAGGLARHLLQRIGPLSPPLLPLAGLAGKADGLPGMPNGAQALRQALPALARLPPPQAADGTALPWAEPPQTQADRVAAAVLAGASNTPLAATQAAVRAQARADGFAPATADHMALAADVTAQWLWRAGRAGAGVDGNAGAAEPFHGWRPTDAPAPGAASPAATAFAASHTPPPPTCTLPLALIDAHGQGVAGWLTLHRVYQPGAQLCLAPAPASALLLRAGHAWDDALARLHQPLPLVLDQAKAADPHRPPGYDIAIAWDVLLPTGAPLAVLQGDSAGATLALGTLWLLRDLAVPPWRQQLVRLLASDLKSTACTAALGGSFSLQAVGGALLKAQCLHAMATLLATLPGQPALVLHVSRHEDLPSQPPTNAVPLCPHPGLLHLLHQVADKADPLNPDQQTLLTLLLAGKPDEPLPTPADAAGDKARKDLLEAVFKAPATRLRTWLLRCWAEWERALGGQVQQHFVQLQVQPDALGPGQPQLQEKPEAPDELPGVLAGVLARHDRGTRHRAYTLRGAPGAGKTTLLRHHQQVSARRLLQALGQPGGLQWAAPGPKPRVRPEGRCAATTALPQPQRRDQRRAISAPTCSGSAPWCGTGSAVAGRGMWQPQPHQPHPDVVVVVVGVVVVAVSGAAVVCGVVVRAAAQGCRRASQRAGCPWGVPRLTACAARPV